MDRNTHTDIVTNGKQQVTGIEQIIVDSIKDFNKIAGSEEFVLENVGRAIGRSITTGLHLILRYGERFELPEVQG